MFKAFIINKAIICRVNVNFVIKKWSQIPDF